MADDSTVILDAIEKSSSRTEVAINTLSGEIRTMAHAITEGFHAAPHYKPNGNGGLYGIVASFSIVIISLGSIFFAMIGSQAERTSLLAEFQRERLEIFESHVDATLSELDVKLQQEIGAEAALRDQRFTQADKDSGTRHDAQQKEIDEMKGWFRPPRLRIDGNDGQ